MAQESVSECNGPEFDFLYFLCELGYTLHYNWMCVYCLYVLCCVVSVTIPCHVMLIASYFLVPYAVPIVLAVRAVLNDVWKKLTKGSY